MSGLKDEGGDTPPVPSCLPLKSDQSMPRGITCRVKAQTQILPGNTNEEKKRNLCHRHFILSVKSVTLCPLVRISSTDVKCYKGCVHLHRGKRTSPASQTRTAPDGLQEVLEEHRISLRRRYERVTEGTDGSETLLNRIFTELYITQGRSEEVNTQHEVRQLETASRKETLHDTPIKCQDIFKALPDQQTHIRAVLTNGVAGVGKTFSVQKFTLDWTEGLENQEVSLVIPLSFRELNLIKAQQYSLLRLLHVFHPALQKVTAEQLAVAVKYAN
ncbi:NACHT, LRR and PYD domains-containing protein 12-like [Eleginops maclovinus]|uniref:NACHT, LRR and PYD domains-containing protein 12-like n=1 Tax=Eleginops maclovinus TaxID=56733 RepID=UPI00307FD755